LSFAMEMPIQLGEYQKKIKEAAVADRQEGEGYKSAENMISGRVTSPAQEMKQNLYKQSAGAKQETTEAQSQAALQKGMEDLLPYTATVFINTFLNTVLANFLQGGTLFGFCVTGNCSMGSSEDFATDYESSGSATYGRTQVEAAVTRAMTVRPSPPQNYNIMAELYNCPDFPGTFNCAANEGLLKAVQQAEVGDPMTIAEALEQGFLNADFPLLSEQRVSENENPATCRDQAYCIGNVRALRLAGILPLGFEIAASISDPYAPSRLGDVVKNFYTITSPYYHLVDPNWVLKVPVSKCGKEAYTPTMLSTGPNRLKECVDLQQCVGFDRQGNCFAYGYCTRTKNVWRFNVDTCEPQYRSCKVFTDNTGTSKSYLYRTVDTGECTADNTGCSAYSLAKDEAGKWNMSGVGIFWQRDDTDAKSWVFTPKVINLNKNVSANCPSNSAGCSAFQWSENTATAFYLKKAPDYLKCYDTVPGTAKIDFPQTPSDLSKISDYLSDADFPTRAWKKQECALYAQPCIPEEVNCNWYTQKGGLGIRVPGKFKPAEVANNEVVAWNDQCDAQCVGYDTYKEMNSNYANGKDRVYILPSAGTLCAAADAGCTGFTNLETAKGGVANTEYFSYLRSCIKPDVQRQKTYYTYEGADASGFQLKTYLLQMDDVGTSEPGVARPGGPK